MMNYNTSIPPIILKEYGRNVQKLVNYLKTIEDTEERTTQAHSLISLMRQIIPTVKETSETSQRLWDDLYIMADFDLELDSPYPKPLPEILNKKPERMRYSTNRIKYKHYGKNIELLIKEAINKTDPQDREDAIIYIGKLMKSFYGSWNKEVSDDEVILDNIKTISGGELTIDLEKVQQENLFERLYKARTRKPADEKEAQRSGRRSNNGRKSNQRSRRKN